MFSPANGRKKEGVNYTSQGREFHTVGPTQKKGFPGSWPDGLVREMGPREGIFLRKIWTLTGTHTGRYGLSVNLDLSASKVMTNHLNKAQTQAGSQWSSCVSYNHAMQPQPIVWLHHFVPIEFSDLCSKADPCRTVVQMGGNQRMCHHIQVRLLKEWFNCLVFGEYFPTRQTKYSWVERVPVSSLQLGNAAMKLGF